MLQGGSWTQRDEYGHERGVGSYGTYTVDDDALTLTDGGCCGVTTLAYTFDGATLKLNFPKAGPTTCGSNVSCYTRVVIFGTVSFRKID